MIRPICNKTEIVKITSKSPPLEKDRPNHTIIHHLLSEQTCLFFTKQNLLFPFIRFPRHPPGFPLAYQPLNHPDRMRLTGLSTGKSTWRLQGQHSHIHATFPPRSCYAKKWNGSLPRCPRSNLSNSLLGNHTLRQLNLQTDGPKSSFARSVTDLMAFPSSRSGSHTYRTGSQ